MLIELKKIYRKEQFNPKFLGIFINPFYLGRRELFDAIYESSELLSGELLDVGCGSMPYRDLFQVASYTGLDLDTDMARFRNLANDFYDGNIFPYRDNKFDCILCNQVLEHVFNPENFLYEVSRVLKSRGKLLITIPFLWDEHEQPSDYARYSSFGLIHLLEKNGFRVILHKKLGADFSAVFQIVNVYLYKVTKRFPKWAKFILNATLVAVINMLGEITKLILPRNEDLFLNQLVVAEKR